MTRELDDGSIRITQQFRDRDAMGYDLRSSGGRLTLRITGRGAFRKLGDEREHLVKLETLIRATDD